jgi:hypothetical protein
MSDLKKMFEERQGHPMMKARNDAYKIFHNYINSQGKNGKVQLTFKPFAQMDVRGSGEGGDHKLAINLSRRVHSYFTSTFARVPHTWKLPKGMEPADEDKAERLTFWLNGIFTASRVDAAQSRQASWLSGRGDCVFAVDYDEEKGEILIRTYDPEWCYPTLHPFDVGGVQDMLIAFSTPKKWAEAEYGITIRGEKSNVQVFHYWDRDHFEAQVEGTSLPKHTREHDLGFCPFRWVFGSADGNFAQSDIRDIPSLQDFYNENLLLAMDSIRKQVDKAWIAFGVNKDITPKPGMAIAVKSAEAKLQEFPAGADTSTIMAVMQMLEAGVEATTGISPASSRGAVHGVGTGAAIRNQVQAVEARNEARKQAFEDAYAMVGNYAFRVLEKRFSGEKKVGTMTENGYIEVSGVDVDGHYLCQSEYGGFVGMDLAQRIQGSLQGLGRIYDDTEAIRLAALPGVNPLVMRKRVDDYQKRLAITAAQGQSMAQHAMQNTQEPSPEQMGQPPMPPGAMPQQQQQAPSPQSSQRGLTSIADVERAIEALKGKLHGSVWAVGELAIAGMAARPLVMVGSEKDLGPVTALMQSVKTHVLPGHPGEMPSLLIA